MDNSSIPSHRTSLIFQPDNHLIRVKDISEDKKYVVMSTEPGRKIRKWPKYEDGNLHFSINEIQLQGVEGIGVVEFDEYFCQATLGGEVHREIPLKSQLLYVCKFKAKVRMANWDFLNPQVLPKYAEPEHLEMYPPEDLNAHDIQAMLEYVNKTFGLPENIETVRNCLILSFPQPFVITNMLKLPENSIKQHKTSVTLSYWGITNHRPLYTYEPLELIQLPHEKQIKKLVVLGEWAVALTTSEVIFLHMYRPLENFFTLESEAQGLETLGGEKVLVFKRKYIEVYQIFSFKNPELYSRVKVKKFEPYCLAFKGKDILMGGINYSPILNKPTQDKSIILINNWLNGWMEEETILMTEESVKVCEANSTSPILGLVFVEDLGFIVCACEKFVYCLHWDSANLLSIVELAGHVEELQRVELGFNLINVLAAVRKGVVRVGWEETGGRLGTEVQNITDATHVAIHNKIIYYSKGHQLIGASGQLPEKTLHTVGATSFIGCLAAHQSAICFQIVHPDYMCLKFMEV